jgi:hypothetical protein
MITNLEDTFCIIKSCANSFSILAFLSKCPPSLKSGAFMDERSLKIKAVYPSARDKI